MSKQYIILSTLLPEKNNAPSLREKAFCNFLSKDQKKMKFIGIEKDLGLIKNCFYIFNTVNKLLKITEGEIIIVFRNIFLTPFLLFLKLRFTIEIIQDFHGYYYLEIIKNKNLLKILIAYLFDKMANKLSDKIISVSKGISEYQIPHCNHKVFLVPNGIDRIKIQSILEDKEVDLGAKRIFNKHKNNFNLGFCGNAGNWFNIEYVINEVKKIPDITFFIIGNGYNFETLRCQIKEEKIENIVFLGVLENTLTLNLLNYMEFLVTPYNKDNIRSKIKYLYSAKKNREYIFLKKPILISSIPGKDYIFKDNKGVVMYEDGIPGSFKNSIEKLRDKKFYKKKVIELENLQQNIDINDLISKSRVFD